MTTGEPVVGNGESAQCVNAHSGLLIYMIWEKDNGFIGQPSEPWQLQYYKHAAKV